MTTAECGENTDDFSPKPCQKEGAECSVTLAGVTMLTGFFLLLILGSVTLKELIIAIDGPVGSGKSTLARRVAELMGYVYVDTGAMYRALALKALRHSISFEGADDALVALARKDAASICARTTARSACCSTARM